MNFGIDNRTDPGPSTPAQSTGTSSAGNTNNGPSMPLIQQVPTSMNRVYGCSHFAAAI